MRADQRIEVLKNGLNNTLFKNEKSLVRNLYRFFGDGVIMKESCNLVEDKIIYTFNITSSEYAPEPYDRHIKVFLVRFNNYGIYHYKIIDIEEC